MKYLSKFIIILTIFSLSFVGLHSTSSELLTDAIYYGTPEARKKAIYIIGAQKILKGIRPMAHLLTKWEKGDIILDRELVSQICVSFGRISHPVANESLLNLLEFETKHLDDLIKGAKKEEQEGEKKDKQSGSGVFLEKDNISYHTREEVAKSVEILMKDLLALGRIARTSIIKYKTIFHTPYINEWQKKSIDKINKYTEEISLIEKASPKLLKAKLLLLRLTTIKAMGMSGYAKFLSKLEGFLAKGENSLIKVQAAYSLLRINATHPEARNYIFDAITVDDVEVRLLCAKVIKELRISAFLEPVRSAIRLESDFNVLIVLKNIDKDGANWGGKCCYHDVQPDLELEVK